MKIAVASPESLSMHIYMLTLKAPITTAADHIHKYFFIVFRENKT